MNGSLVLFPSPVIKFKKIKETVIELSERCTSVEDRR